MVVYKKQTYFGILLRLTFICMGNTLRSEIMTLKTFLTHPSPWHSARTPFYRKGPPLQCEKLKIVIQCCLIVQMKSLDTLITTQKKQNSYRWTVFEKIKKNLKNVPFLTKTVKNGNFWKFFLISSKTVHRHEFWFFAL